MHISRTSCLAVVAVLAALAATASIAPSASAATQRYASPTGSGTDCKSASPCSFRQAVEHAGGGDEVIVNPGDYPLTAQSLHVGGVTVHGVAGRPRPRLLFSSAPTPSMLLNGSTLRYVEVVRAPGEQGIALGANDAALDQVVVRGSAQPGWQTVFARDSTIRNSIVVAPGSGGTAIWTDADGAFASGTYRNVTAIATESGGVAIRANAVSGGYASVLARNVIARGGPGGAGFRAWTDNKGATAKITVGHSNWLGGSTLGSNASLVDGGGNQSSAPTFVSAAGGDYRQAAGSPTIDAGLDEAINGAFDIDGDPRQIGGIDIGADEFVVAPAATTGLADAVSDRSANLSGTVDTSGAPTTYHFEYGLTTAYGSATPDASSVGAVAAASVAGLSPATTYHYRLVATNAGGIAKGTDRTFTTSPTLTTTAPIPTASTPVPPFAGVTLVSRRLTYARRFIAVQLSCPAGTVGRCSGNTKLTARRRTSSRRVTLGRARFSIAADRRAMVRVRVSRIGQMLLRGVPRLRGSAVNAAGDGTGRSKTTVTAVTIRRRHR